jgi:hypothetical protein
MKKLKILFALFLLMNGISYSQTGTSNAAVVKGMLIFPPQSLHTHGSSIVNLPNGDFSRGLV